MKSTAVPASIGADDSPRAAAQLASAVDAVQVTLPAMRMRVDKRGLALRILAALASVFALSWAQAFVVPLLLGIVLSYTLNPLVAWLEAIRIPRVAGTIIVMASVIGACFGHLFVARADADRRRTVARSGDTIRGRAWADPNRAVR